MNSSSRSILLSALTTFSTFAYAAQDSTPSSTQQMPSQYHGDITPLAGPIVREWAGLYVSADFIYWQMREDGLEYAHDGVTTSGATASKQGGYKNFDFAYEPGFKVGLGTNFRHDGWDLFLNYTWFENSRTAHASVHSSRGVLDVIEYDGTFPDSSIKAEAHWHLLFNVVDFELGRNFYISQHLAVRPFIGLKASWMSQRLNVNNYPQSGGEHLLKQKQHFWGGGLRGGAITDWHFTRNWSLYGNLALAELYSLFQDKLHGVQAFQKRIFHTIVPVLEMGLGVRYETFFSQDRYQLFAQLGWEQQVWWGQNQFILTDAPNMSSNNLVLQGLDLKFGFNF